MAIHKYGQLWPIAVQQIWPNMARKQLWFSMAIYSKCGQIRPNTTTYGQV